jgi:uncharacterized membrane protein
MAKDNTLVVFTVDTKEQAHSLLKRLVEIDIDDDDIEITGAAFAHKRSRGRVKLEQSDDLGGGRGALGGGAIGLIAGTMVAGPVGAAVGGAVGAAVSGLYTQMRDSGVNNDFMKQVGKQLEPGKTALFILYNGVLGDDMIHTLEEYNATVTYGTLPEETGTELKEIYEESGEEVVSEIDVFTEEATEEDTEATEVDVAEVSAVAHPESAPTSDNLTVIDGIGPKISQTLIANGITTYEQLHRSSEINLREILKDAGMVVPRSLPTWPKQAGMAAADDWKGLYEFNAKRKLANAKK